MKPTCYQTPPFNNRLRQLAVAVMFACAVAAPLPLQASQLCPPDVNADGFVTEDDLHLALPVIFFPSFTAPDVIAAADANGDRKVGAADVVAIIGALGRDCSLPSPTPSLTPSLLPTAPPTATPTPSASASAIATGSPTATAPLTATPTPTLTRTATSTVNPTVACLPTTLSGTGIAGTLSAGDCLRPVGDSQRPSDAYTINVAVNQEVTINVTSTTATLLPYLILIDASQGMGDVRGLPPLRFTSLSGGLYTFIVTSAPNSPAVLGDYQVSIGRRTCPAPVSLSVPSTRPGSIAGDECTDPNLPGFGTRADGVDLYNVMVNSVPLNVTITMLQVTVDASIFPEMSLYTPSGSLLLDSFDTIDCTGDADRECIQIRFLALEVGPYRLAAGGGGGTGTYRVTITSPTCRATALGVLPASGPVTCPGQSAPGCIGAWYGDVRRSPCAAPLIEVDDDVADNGSASDLYSFSANARDIVRIQLSTAGSPFLYVVGPASAGNPLVAAASGFGSDAELTVALPATGTYIVIAANGTFLDPPDDDEGEIEEYELFIERAVE